MQYIFNDLLAYFKEGNLDETLTGMSNTTEWKCTPFTRSKLSWDQMTSLIKKQKQYLHKVYAMLVINMCSLEGTYYKNQEDTEYFWGKLSIINKIIKMGQRG